MAKKSGIGQRFYVHGYDISGDVGSVQTASAKRALLEITGIDKAAPERISGLSDGELDFNVWFNDAVGQEHVALQTMATDKLVMYLMGTTRGDAAACLSAEQVSYEFARGNDGQLSGSVKAQSSQGIPLEWGIVLAPKTTHATASSETGINDSAQTTAGAVGYLQHFSAGTATVTYKIEHSSDSTNGIDGAWTTLMTFTTVPTPWTPQAQRLEVSGTVKKYVRATTSGSGTNMVFAMAFRRKTATDI